MRAVYAIGEDYIDETLVYATLERGAVEPGYWFDIGRDDSGQFMRHNVVLEYGITDHWMVDGRATGIDERRDGFHFDSSRLETRYRFFDEGMLPVDIAASGEINSNRDQDRPSNRWHRATAHPLENLVSSTDVQSLRGDSL